MTDGETTSSAGSDKAPSEDNLEPEEIAEVIPVEEDPTLARLARAGLASGVKDKSKEEGGKLLSSPLKRRITLVPKAKTLNMLTRSRTKQGAVLASDHKSKHDSDLEDSPSQANEEKKDKSEDTEEGQGVHKKKLKKNIDSRDACTQTERSDYMLIKQRQKQKEIMAMAKQGMLPPGVTAQ